MTSITVKVHFYKDEFANNRKHTLLSSNEFSIYYRKALRSNQPCFIWKVIRHMCKYSRHSLL